jgi:hypothetical protein
MSSRPIVKSRNLESTAPKKGSAKSNTSSRRKVPSTAAIAKKPPRSVQSKAERVAAAKTPVKIDQPQVAALPRPLGPRDHLQASGAGVRRPLHGHRTEAGAGRRRFAKPRLSYTRAADLLEAGHAARAGVARDHPHGPHPCRRHRVARPALPFPLPGRAKDHGHPLVRPAILRPQAAAGGRRSNV